MPKIIAYDTYKDVRGDAAKPFSVAMGIDEPSQFSHTGYLVEIRETQDHVRLSAHATTYSREVLIYNNRSLEIIDLDTVAKEARKTVMKPDGEISVFTAPWNNRIGYAGEEKLVESFQGQTARVSSEWEKYDSILTDAEVASWHGDAKLGLPQKPKPKPNTPPPSDFSKR